MNSPTTESPPYQPDYKLCDKVGLVMSGLTIFLFVICITGNIVSLITWIRIARVSKFSSSICIFIVLAISDSFLMAILLLARSFPYYVYGYQGNDGLFMTNIYPYLLMYVWPFGSIALFISMWMTTIMSVQRFLVLSYPFGILTARLTSQKSTFIQIACVSITATVYNMPMFFEYQLVFDHTTNHTTLAASDLLIDPIYQIVYATTCYFLFMNALPLIITLTTTIMIIKILIKSEKARTSMSTSQIKDRGITISLVTIVIVFIVCQVPNMVNRIMQMTNGLGDSPCGRPEFFIQEVATFLIAVNATVNFFIFASCSSEFRRVAMTICCGKLFGVTNIQEDQRQNTASGSTSLSTLQSTSNVNISIP